MSLVFETLAVRKEGAVLFAEISAPPMNLLGPELVRDLVSLIQRAEADDAGRGWMESKPGDRSRPGVCLLPFVPARAPRRQFVF